MKRKIFIYSILLVFMGCLSSAGIEDWSIRIGVKTDKFRDSYNFLGVAVGASLGYDIKDIPEPPPSFSGLCLYFPHYDWSFRPGRYAADFRPPLIDYESYKLVVEARDVDRLTLFWSNVEGVPEGYRLTLVDEARGISIDMREETEYEFGCEQGCRSEFEVVVERILEKQGM